MPEREELLAIIRKAGEVGCEVVLDEAFIDFVDESRSFIPEIKGFPHVIIVRSMTKMYAIPGIRLGYAVAHPNVIASLEIEGAPLECQRDRGRNRSGLPR